LNVVVMRWMRRFPESGQIALLMKEVSRDIRHPESPKSTAFLKVDRRLSKKSRIDCFSKIVERVKPEAAFSKYSH